MDKESQEKTAFICQGGLYEFTRLPFGAQGSGGQFQMIMSDVLRGMSYRDVIVYVDDILIFNTSFEKHVQSLQEVFDRLRKAGLKLHPKKCNFAIPEIKFLGHRINKFGISADPKKIEIIKNWLPQKQPRK